LSVSMLHINIYAACPSPVSILHVHVHAACSYSCCLSILCVYVHVHVHAAYRPC
jgi:ribulose-5-phosphate 4-epimerase/fuculose-1-phosphate aldolase